MAITAKAVWEGRTTGTATGGGVYDPGVAGVGVDYTQQDSPQLTVTDGSITTGTTTLSSSTGGFTGEMIGSGVYISSDPTQRYIITAYTNTNTVTIDRNITTGGTGLTVNVGGAISDLATITFASVNGNLIYLKYHSTNVYEVSGGLTTRSEAAISSTWARGWMVKGYDQASERTPGSLASNRPTIRRTDTTIVGTGGHQKWIDLIFDVNNTSGSFFYSVSTYVWTFYRCKFINGLNSTVVLGWYAKALLCEFVDCAVSQCYLWHCVSLYSGSSWAIAGASRSYNTIAIQTSGARQGGGISTYGTTFAKNCISIGFSEAFRFDNNTGCVLMNCLAVDADYGFSHGNVLSYAGTLVNCASYNCTNPVRLGVQQQGNILNNNYSTGSVLTLTENPFVDQTAYDFRLNDLPGGGRLLKGTCDPDFFPGLSPDVRSFTDVGVFQHKDMYSTASGKIPLRPRR